MAYLSLIPRRIRSVSARPSSDVDRFFDEFFRGFELSPTWSGETSAPSFQPHLDISETEKDFRVEAELPGLEDKDVDLSLDANTLVIRGEKKTEKEDKGKNIYRQERVYGTFLRQVELPTDIDVSKVNATFKNGVLSVVLPKSEKAKEETRKIPIKAG